MDNLHLEATIKAYLQAFEQRDLAKCMEIYARDALIDFALGAYQGTQAIEEWHKDRFAADLRVLHVDEIRTSPNTVVVDAQATSKVARAWMFNSFAGRVTFTFEQDKVKKATFGLRTALPFEGW
jgi:hypothetical protein